jgi:adenine-specific DNA-methyltransferase
MAPEIVSLLKNKGLLEKNLTFFDAFCGMGSVSEAVKEHFDVKINDILISSVTYTRGRLVANRCVFDNLGFDPFEFFNSNEERMEDFMFKTYSPGGSERMYFTPENAGRIDYFRFTIEDWYTSKKIDDDEYHYLLACLIESVSFVSNTAGVYGAFLKKWDSRALKPIQFLKVDSVVAEVGNLKYYNSKIEHIIRDVECDILYLDPPYTQNQYGTQYHLLETLVLDDNPSVSKITGSRPVTPKRSDWSINFKTHIHFDYLLANTKAKYILFSYSPDGFMTKEFIDACMKRYGKPETYQCKKIDYKRYVNWKSKKGKNHFEYLFFIELKESKDVKYASPLNYIGSKAKLIDEIREHLPNEEISTFVDAFGGGLNVGININADSVIYNDNNHIVSELMNSFKENDTYKYLLYIRQKIKKFGLEKKNGEAYYKARDYYNSLPVKKRDSKLLYTIIMYGFNQQIRFNSNHEFNNPVGMRWMNEKVLEKMISFSRAVKQKQVIFHSFSYDEIEEEINPNTFYYMDPPYLLTTGAYNDGKRGFTGWNEQTENQFLKFADRLHENGNHFMISYVLDHNGKSNETVKSWIKERGYRLITLEPHHVSKHVRHESLIVNY